MDCSILQLPWLGSNTAATSQQQTLSCGAASPSHVRACTGRELGTLSPWADLDLLDCQHGLSIALIRDCDDGHDMSNDGTKFDRMNNFHYHKRRQNIGKHPRMQQFGSKGIVIPEHVSACFCHLQLAVLHNLRKSIAATQLYMVLVRAAIALRNSNSNAGWIHGLSMGFEQQYALHNEALDSTTDCKSMQKSSRHKCVTEGTCRTQRQEKKK